MPADTGIVLLAAGSSSRLGEPKQLLQYQGKSLLQHSCKEALNSSCKPLVVVLGSEAESLVHEIDQEPLHIVINHQWEEGMSSSIRCGLTGLINISPGVSSAIFILCDQPYLSSDLLDSMIDKRNSSDKGIVACSYGDTLGTPVLFDKSYFTDLMELKGQEGAKVLLYKYRDDLNFVPFPQGTIDIDTRSDYLALENKKK